VFYGHDAENISNYDAVVYTVAISEDNPEYVRAGERGIPCISRADFMGYLMTGYNRRIGISGMHGKSTCTSMCASVFMNADADPTVLSGASLKSMGGAYRIGGNDNFVFEACEYMDSFLDFYPTIAVILNVEMDHVDYFKSMDHIYSSFGKFADITASTNGCVVYNSDDENVKKSIENFSGRRIGFAVNDTEALVRAVNITYDHGYAEFDVVLDKEEFCHVKLAVTGEHNVYNALAACTVAYLCGIGGEKISLGLAAFTGADRRMEFKGTYNGADIYDDYAHHPGELHALLAAVRTMGYQRVICAFQPHTYTRTNALLQDFVRELKAADIPVLTDIYAARERNHIGISSKMISDQIPGSVYCPTLQDVAAYLRQIAQPGDLILTVGAGDIYKAGDSVLIKD